MSFDLSTILNSPIVDFIKNLDWTILHWIQGHLRMEILDQVLPIITRLGDHGLIWIILAVILLIPRRTRRTAILILIGMAAAYLIGTELLKSVIARPRPCWVDDTVVLLISEPKDYSFPSGHTMAGTVFCFLINRVNKVIGFFAVLLLLVMAFSRMYLYVHFPSDVLAGMIIGILFGVLTWLIGGRWAARGRLPKEPDFWEGVV